MDKLEAAADAPDGAMSVDVKKDVVKDYWKNFNIKHSIWFVKDAWGEVTQSCLNGTWKKLCPDLTNSFKGFNVDERLSKTKLECVQFAKRVGFTSHEEELTAEELDELEAQCQREVEEEATVTAPEKLYL
ncbi:hypothetical protein Pmani_012483 [Petrolisthes manimaculis]|uniref:Uncharacterized protein n=1 Tax=Petrolisthes manimaculis TaxID=1843537 RepID=A0AAE1UF15_9EUCA|nr:hypothetical protein Pmani_012483 [Petrolisthes manimaculis]